MLYRGIVYVQVSDKRFLQILQGKKGNNEKRKQSQVDSFPKREAKQPTKRNSKSFVRDTFIPEKETLPSSERANFKATSNNPNDKVHDYGKGQTKPNVNGKNFPSFEEAKVVGKDYLKNNYPTNRTDDKGIDDTKQDHSLTENAIFIEKERQSNQLEESNNSDWLALSDFTTPKEIDQIKETTLLADSGTINTRKNKKETSPETVDKFAKEEISEKNFSKDDLYLSNYSTTLPLESDVLEKDREEKQDYFDNESVDEKKDSDDFIDDMNDELNSEDNEGFEEDFEIDPIDEENEEEEDESGEEENKKKENHESLDSNKDNNEAPQRKVRIPGGKLNWKAESKVNSGSGYKPRRSQKKIRTYKVDYSNTKSRLYSSSTKIDSVREDSKAQSSTSSRVRKSSSSLDQPSARPKLYGSSLSSFPNVGK